MDDLNKDDQEFIEKNKLFLKEIDIHYDEGLSYYETKLAELAIVWAKENLAQREYDAIAKSRNTMAKKQLIFIFALVLPISIAWLIVIIINPFFNMAFSEEISVIWQIVFACGAVLVPAAIGIIYITYSKRKYGRLWVAFFKDWKIKRRTVRDEYYDRMNKYKRKSQGE